MKKLRVLTYNIHQCVGTDGQQRPERIARIIEDLDADVVALQEVQTFHDGGTDLLWLLTNQGQYHAIPGPTITMPTSAYGNALLLRQPETAVKLLNLSMPHREPRGAISASFLHEGYQIGCINTHLGLSPAERREQVRMLLSHLGTQTCDIQILCGDINEWFLWGRPLRWLTSHFSPSPVVRTFPTVFPLFSLDRIWANPPNAMAQTTVVRTPHTRVASDHYPIWTNVNLDAAQKNQ